MTQEVLGLHTNHSGQTLVTKSINKQINKQM